MRLILATVFVLCAVVGILQVLGLLGGMNSPLAGTLWGVVMAPLLVILVVVAAVLFNLRSDGGKSAEAHERYLEENGLLVEERYTATRAFNVEEYDDEGSMYFVELADGRVLFLIGQYLYEYEPITDDPELNQPRTFPCTEFTLRRLRDEGYVYDIRCAGEVFEPEATAPPLGKEVWREGVVPEDGEIISDRSYDEIKREHLQRKG